MNSPNSDDGHDEMREALRRDAARVPEAPFDAVLHHVTMRRIRALAEPAADAPRFRLLPTLTTAVAVLALAALLVWWWPHSSLKISSPEAVDTHFTTNQTAPRASLLAYQAAASAGDEALSTMLDRDARDLLPASSPIFNATLR